MEHNKVFKQKTKKELDALSIPELVDYYKKERAHILENDLPLSGIKFKSAIHPLMYLGLLASHKQRNFDFEVNGKAPNTKRPVIYSASHIGLLDIDASLHAIKKHAYIFADDEEFMYRTSDGTLFDLNGRIYVDNDDREDKRVALGLIKKLLKEGESVLWFPEGTWNISPNMVIQPCAFGMIEAAYETNALIVPLGLHQIDGDKKTKFIVNIGKPIDIAQYDLDNLTKADKIELIEEVRAEMGALKMAAWPEETRENIQDQEQEDFIARRIAEWPFYTEDKIRSRVFNPNHYVSEEEAFEHLRDLEINKNNAFLAKSKGAYVKQYKRK